VGEVVTVPGLTEDELREAAIQASLDALPEEAPPLGPGEFTSEQWRAAYQRRHGVRISDTTAGRKLDELVATGVLEKGDRKKPDGRNCVGYWEVGD